MLPGNWQLILVLLIKTGEAQVFPPIVTVAPLIKPVPEMVRVEPPASFPLVGLTVVTVGKVL